MMAVRGFLKVVVYLDDFLIIESSLERCLVGQNVLIRLLHSLGFDIAWDKVEGQSQWLLFWGVEIDTVADELRLPEKKLVEFEKLVADMLQATRVSLKQLQVFAGKLNWASSVVRGGRIYLRRILDVMKPLKGTRHKYRITVGMKQDLQWWRSFLQVFNGKRTISYSSPEPRYVFVDACETGGGCYCEGDWQYVVWRQDWPQLTNAHINVKEGAMVLVAAYKWGNLWSNAEVVVRIDNYTAASAINKGTSRCVPLMDVVRALFWKSVWGNYKIHCWYLPGVENWLADAVSRLNEPDKVMVLANFLGWRNIGFTVCWPWVLRQHMSHKAFLVVVPQVLRWLGSERSGGWRHWV
jgi:hypothetical protein